MQTTSAAITIDDENEYKGVAGGQECAPCSVSLKHRIRNHDLCKANGRVLHANLSHVDDPIVHYSIPLLV